MPCGLYGKLPAKRDFIAIGIPRGVLTAWEPWLQGGLSASRASLGEGWRDAFLRAPIWRFWLGAGIAGEAVLGAFMPSVDGIGRYFPLTLIGTGGEGPSPPPPEYEPFDAWFAEAEDFLLATLSSETGFEAVTRGIADLPDPVSTRRPSEAGALRLRGGTLVSETAAEAFRDTFSALRPLDHGNVHAGMSYWWTQGGEGFAPRALASRGLPDPYVFAGLLTGGFDALGL